jgi:hypothetical protein
MKNFKRPSASKLLIRFDNELKELLTTDLKSFMEKNPFLSSNKQATRPTLSVA